MDTNTLIFQRIVYAEALITPNWRKHFFTLIDADITSIEEFLLTPDETLDKLSIPVTPKDRLKQLKQRLNDMQQQRHNSFSQPFQQNEIFDHFEFVPQFLCEQYFNDANINDLSTQLKQAMTTVAKSGYDGITEHQAIMIALYCQEGKTQMNSFYYLVNKCLRERQQNLICLRPAIYLLDSALRALPKIKTITWRGINIAPDETKFIVGREVCFAGICSTSTDKKKALEFMEIPTLPGVSWRRTLFKMHMNAGISIQNWSCIKDESEVVAPFCSRWKVLSKETDRDEPFDEIGNRPCDYIIELEQLEGETLFQNHDSPIGLHLLSKINFRDQFDELQRDFKKKFISFFNQLTEPTAKSILENFWAENWDKIAHTFQATCGKDEIVFNHFTQFIGGIHNLLHEFEGQNFDVRTSFRICERHNIYSERQLLWCADGSERTIEQLCHIGFSDDCSKKLFEQDALKKELENYYKSSKLSLHGTAEDPKNVSRWLSDLRFKHCVWRDGNLICCYELAKLSINGVKKISPQINEFINVILYQSRLLNNAMLTWQIQRSDLIFSTVIFAVEFGSLCFQLCHGDITFKQFLKSVTTSAVAITAGTIGASIGSCFGTALMMYFGFLGWPVTVGALCGTIVGGLVLGMTFEMLYQKFLETVAPDGDKEDTNALRKLYLAALETLNCTPDSTITTIKRAYYQLALATHPDKFENKQSATEEFQKVVAAYEIAKNYHEVLDKAFKALDIPSDISINQLKIWVETNRCWGEKRKTFKIIERHVAYSSDNMKWLRDRMDSDRHLKLKNSKYLPIAKK